MSATNGTHQEQAPAAASEPAPATPSKDEIGWYFVESYYTTLSKTPEKLHVSFGCLSRPIS